MAGEAKTTSFMLSSATLMVGPMADLFTLDNRNSLGLVKDLTLKTNPTFTELTQGTQNKVVYSIKTAEKVDVQGQMFEYTAANLAYAAALDGSSFSRLTVSTLVATGLAAPVLPALTAAAVVVTTGDGADFTVGSSWMFEVGNQDQIFIRKVVSVATDTVTFDSGFPVAVPVGTVISKCNIVPVGSLADNIYLGAKISGYLVDGSSDPIVILLPKVRITSGITMAFKTGNSFESQPITLAVQDLVPTDPNYDYFFSVGTSGKAATALLATR